MPTDYAKKVTEQEIEPVPQRPSKRTLVMAHQRVVIWQRMTQLVKALYSCAPVKLCILLYATQIVDAANEIENGNQTKCIQVASLSLPVDEYVPYTTKYPTGFCRGFLGNNMIYGSQNTLYTNNRKLEMFQSAYTFLKLTVGLQPVNDTDHLLVNAPSGAQYAVSQTCLKLAHILYCHWYFPQYRITSSHQSVCREDCEKLTSYTCREEVKVMKEFNDLMKNTNYPFYWDIIDCTQFPWRNVSRTGRVEPGCYYPDNMRDQLDVLADPDCYYGIGKGYNGNVSVTRSGYTCQSWSSQCPHQHRIGPMYPELANASNFCRNPGGLGTEGPWCFTRNPNVTWEYCAVPKCPKRSPTLAPPRVRARNLSSTSIKVTWEQLPFKDRRGILLEYHVECARNNSSEWFGDQVKVEVQKVTFSKLEKFTPYICRVRVVNNFGNGTWSNLVNVSTDEDVPSAPPDGLKAWKSSSTSLNLTWQPVPQPYRNGKIIEYIVRWRAVDKKEKEQFNKTLAGSLSLAGLRKFTEYSVYVSAVTRVGEGPASFVTVKTDQDVPSRSPENVKAISIDKQSIRVIWEKVPPGYENGIIKGYKTAVQKMENDTLQDIKVVNSTGQLHEDIGGLEPNTNYSIRMLAYTAVGDGPASKASFVRTDGKTTNIVEPIKDPPMETGLIIGLTVASVATVSLLVVALSMYFYKLRKRIGVERLPPRLVAPYAVTDIEEIHARPFYEEIQEDEPFNRIPRYRNLNIDGTLNLPPHLRDVFIDFEQLYENLRYMRLKGIKPRRRSISGAIDDYGRPIYDVMSRLVVMTPEPVAMVREPLQENGSGHEKELETSRKRSHSVDLGQVKAFVQAMNEFEGDQTNKGNSFALEQITSSC